MALNWDFTRCKGPYLKEKNRKKDGPEFFNRSGFYMALPWLSLFVDLGEITEKNIPEWLFRLSVLRILHQKTGDHYQDFKFFNRENTIQPDQEMGITEKMIEKFNEFDPFSITNEDLRACINFRTNVASTTRKQFMARAIKTLTREAEEKVVRDHEEKDLDYMKARNNLIEAMKWFSDNE